MVVSLLPADDPDCAAVLAARRRRWPHLLARPSDGGLAGARGPTIVPRPAAD